MSCRGPSGGEGGDGGRIWGWGERADRFGVQLALFPGVALRHYKSRAMIGQLTVTC